MQEGAAVVKKSMVFECNHCDRKFISEDSLTQHIRAKHVKVNDKKEKSNPKKYIIFFMIGLIFVLLGATAYSYSQRPGEYDDFAKCLTEKGAIVYGNDFCSYTGKQLNFFGKSEKYLNYVKCIDNQDLCDSKGVTLTPTWEINGSMHKSVQTFEKLSSLTGCKI